MFLRNNLCLVLNFSTGSDWERVIFCSPDWKHGSYLALNELAQPQSSLQLGRGEHSRYLLGAPDLQPLELLLKTGRAIDNLHQSLPSDSREPPAGFGQTPFAME